MLSALCFVPLLYLVALMPCCHGRCGPVIPYHVVLCRFVTLIDVLYEHRIRVFCSADGEPMDLFVNIMTLQEARAQRTNMVRLSAVYYQFLHLWTA